MKASFRFIFPALGFYVLLNSGLYAQNTDMVRIPAGILNMGSPGSEASRQRDETQRQVPVGEFYLSDHEVTQQEYERVMGRNPSRFKGPNLPVEKVSWYDAIDYCNALSELEGLVPAYTIKASEILWDHDADGYRLPTEVEWEYACRAGTRTAFHTGKTITTGQANYDGNYPYNKAAKGRYRRETVRVKSFAPNAWNLYDMHGNVFEWCWDQYKSRGSPEDLDGSLQRSAVIRGGSWFSEARFLRSANRSAAPHETRSEFVGFRVVRSAF
jgi:formylglycine-generating enzyme required for sulfatase activity